MSLRWYSTVVEARDHRALARWWAEALGWDVAFETEKEAAVLPPWAKDFVEILDFHRVPPGMLFVPVGHEKNTKNRLHWDFAPHISDDRDAEIERLLDLGARIVDVGAPDDATWTVLADPEGNEFCVLSSRKQ
ncbi:VOC family protein [Nesterenkonia xinjiangensis]|uniref:Putative enzyme related to lactoylglutathione lyase n=1 Tax=Nesterenkonia xinjiangensis TaxID=225327 RepID=A0A7Z0GQ04_9MICC|nr:VOC family protein [Nesterenkonia xinjiangensis]NYJ79569.1 putative enzyme related to lactoylglutathione lyase [Nesterenkonia xinjiangensis]